MKFSALCLSAGLLVGVAVPMNASADAPMVKTQAPGFYRAMVGDFEVTALSDGTLQMPATQVMQGDTALVKQALRLNYLPDQVETSVNGYLVNTGSRLVLIDTGAGALFGPGLGKLTSALSAAGYRPEQVDEVCMTHLHGDHIGGLVADGARVFPNAVLRMDKRDADYWLSAANMHGAPQSFQKSFMDAMSMVNPYKAADKLRVFEGSKELVPGVRAQSAYGHTPGHTTYIIESKGQKLILWGDLMHLGAVQFLHPAVTFQGDSDNKQAARARAEAYADAARNGYMVGAAHLSFPGLGRLQAEGKGYRFIPLNYSTLQ
jgi:glyoxylase-like metal-dependent hydrolase (beta-lactamase superfamily II)